MHGIGADQSSGEVSEVHPPLPASNGNEAEQVNECERLLHMPSLSTSNSTRAPDLGQAQPAPHVPQPRRGIARQFCSPPLIALNKAPQQLTFSVAAVSFGSKFGL